MRRDLGFIALVALIAKFAYLYYSNGDFFYPDSFTYLAPARGLLHGRGYVDERGQAEAMRTPGYPLFLVPFVAAGEDVTAGLAAPPLIHRRLGLGLYLVA